MYHNSQLGTFSTSLLLAIPLMYIYRWESPPSTSAQFSVPDNWKSGRIWVRIFPLLPNSSTAGAWLYSLSDLRAHARASFSLVFRAAESVTFPRAPEQMAASTAAVLAGSNAIPTPAPYVLSLQQLYVSSSYILLPFPSSPGAIQGVPPATVAEWTLQGSGNQDFYDGARPSFHPSLVRTE